MGNRGGRRRQGGKKQNAQHYDLREEISFLITKFAEDLLRNRQANDEGRDRGHKGADDQRG